MKRKSYFLIGAALIGLSTLQDVSAMSVPPVKIAPSNLTFQYQPTNRSVVLSWEGDTGKATGFQIYRGLQSFGPFTVIASVSPTARQFTDTTLTTPAVYYYVVYSQGPNPTSTNIVAFNYYPFHPADPDHNMAISQAEYDNYSTCQRTVGCKWPGGPNPIPDSYVGSALTIMRAHGYYILDPTLPAPDCWVWKISNQ